MIFWKKFLLGCAAVVGMLGAAQAAGGPSWDKADIDTTDQASLQRGVKYFVNYCLNCHSAAFMRYNRLTDIGITEQQIKEHLIFTDQKVGETMVSVLDPVQAKAWFGVNPPDLTVIARSRAGANGTGADYLYTYLRSFYRDNTRPTGWNNVLFNNVSMPNPFWELQGEIKPVFEGDATAPVFKGWERVSSGTMPPEEFDRMVLDLVNYMTWMGEPAQNLRKIIGIFVLLFMVIFTAIAWRLNKAYWNDVK